MSRMSAPAASTITAASSHDLGVRSEDLYGQGPLVLGDPEVAEGALVAMVQALTADHL